MTSELAPSGRRAQLILRIATAFATVQALAHLTLFLRSQPTAGSAVWPLAEAMRAQSAPGDTNYWDMYFGYGLLSALTAFLIAALIGLAASAANGAGNLARWLVTIVLIAVAAHAIIIARYFFPLPLYFDAIVALLLGIGWLMLRQPKGG